MLERRIDMTIRLLDNDEFEVDLYEFETGDFIQISGTEFGHGEHPEFDAAIGEEICSWVQIMAEEKEQERYEQSKDFY